MGVDVSCRKHSARLTGSRCFGGCGFTLFELLFVLIILALLVGLLMPMFTGSSKSKPPTNRSPAGHGSPGSVDADIPVFHWPPPEPSTSAEVPTVFLLESEETTPPTLSNFNDALIDALSGAGYSRQAYFAAPDGFVLITQMECIEPDGTPLEENSRWVLDAVSLREFTIRAYLMALLTANPGHYRVIAFIVTPHPFTHSDVEVTSEQADQWLDRGLNGLPDTIGRMPWDARYRCTAMIYEFRRQSRDHMPEFYIPSAAKGIDHLARTHFVMPKETVR